MSPSNERTPSPEGRDIPPRREDEQSSLPSPAGGPTIRSSERDIVRAVVEEMLPRILPPTSVSAYYHGPIPPPGLLKGYQEIDPSFPEQILRRWGDEQNHRHEQERKLLDAHIRQAGRGQVFALVVVLSAILCGGVIALFGDPVVGPVVAAIIETAVLGVFGGVYALERRRRPSRSSTPGQANSGEKQIHPSHSADGI